MNKPLVGVVIINHNHKELLRACLKSWLACDYAPLTLMVSDNASTDGALDMLRDEFPSVRVLAHPRELGFAGAATAGLAALAAEHPLLFLTANDTEVDPDMLSHLVAEAEAHPEAALFGPKIVYQQDRGLIWHLGGYVRPWRGDAGSYGLLRRDDGAFDEPRECDFVSGCGLLLRSQAGQESGFLDASLGFYDEDLDLCLRLRAKGWKIRSAPRARMAHRISATLGSNSPLSAYYTTRNHLGVLWRSRWGAFPLTLLLYATLVLLRVVPPEFRKGWAHGRHYLWHVLQGMLDFARGRYGLRDPADIRKPLPSRSDHDPAHS